MFYYLLLFNFFVKKTLKRILITFYLIQEKYILSQTDANKRLTDTDLILNICLSLGSKNVNYEI